MPHTFDRYNKEYIFFIHRINRTRHGLNTRICIVIQSTIFVENCIFIFCFMIYNGV